MDHVIRTCRMWSLLAWFAQRYLNAFVNLRAIVVVPCAQSETEERGLSARQFLNLKKGLAMPRKTTDDVSTIMATVDR